MSIIKNVLLVLMLGCIAFLVGCSSDSVEEETPAEPDDETIEAFENEVVDCSKFSLFTQQIRLLTRNEYTQSVQLSLGVESNYANSFPDEPTVYGYTNNAKAMAITSRHVDSYLEAAIKISEQLEENNFSDLISCDPLVGTDECASEFITRIGRRMFRRPLSSEEILQYKDLFSTDLTQGSFIEGLKLVTQSFLTSPNFLYRQEIGRKDGQYYTLSNYEIASQLSFLLWGSGPDDALLDTAENNELSTPDGLNTHIQRLIDSPKAQASMTHFAMEWLNSKSIYTTAKDEKTFTTFSQTIREAMINEFNHFVSHVIFDINGSLDELFNANYSFLNVDLARYYRLDSTDLGADFEKVMTSGERGGILMLGALQTSLAHFNETAPVLRGVFVRERLLCHELPSPPPLVDPPPGLDPNLTTRERFARHSEDKACAQCHQYIDDIGFSFEKYDGAGKFRELENGFDIDNSGILRGIDQISDRREITFNGPRELSSILASEPRTHQCFSENFATFAAGRGAKESACLSEKINTVYTSSDGSIKDFIKQYILSDLFLKRDTHLNISSKTSMSKSSD